MVYIKYCVNTESQTTSISIGKQRLEEIATALASQEALLAITITINIKNKYQ